MKNSSKIALHLFIIQCFWALQSEPQKQITTIYCHGVGDKGSQINDYQGLVMQPCKAVEFPDAQIPKGFNSNTFVYHLCEKVWNKKHINRQNMFMGQGKDIETIKQEINPDQDYILFGLCRGGAAIINYMALYNPTNICALVLDEVPANMFDIVEKIMFMDKQGQKIRSSPIQLERWFRWCFPVYPKGSKNTIDTIPNMKNKDLPIFMSYAMKDTTFHFPSSAWKNYIALKKAGFKNVYLCQLQDHGQNAQGHDKKVYLESLHSFYKKFNLPYNPEYAILSDEALLKLQPSLAEITKLLDNYIEKITPTRKAVAIKYATTTRKRS
ncbi:hypothetical protein KBC04_05055 [Candidatus Babeliales bacterium]|nr:hypothetical protein [Candidatus Babeliales bacterium]MBP9844240.1 hypothetical protein [Candidatus Babeliales bacterium]